MQTNFDARQVEYLVRTYSDLIARISYTWFSNTADVQDISQTVFLKLLTSRTSFETAELERAWIIRMTLNACKDLKKSFWRRRVSGFDENPELAVTMPDPEDNPVLAAVQSLPLKYRNAIYLHYYEGYQVQEIAGMTGETPGTVSAHLSRGRKKLRGKLRGLSGGNPYEQASVRV